MNLDTSIKTIAIALRNQYQLSVSGNNLLLDGLKTTSKQLQTIVLKLELGDTKEAAEIKLLSFTQKAEYNMVVDRTYQAILTKLKQQKIDKVITSTLDSKLSYVFKDVVPIRDIITGDKFIFDVSKDLILPLDYETWYDSLPMDKELRSAILGREMRGVVKYNPYKLASKIEVDFEGQRIYQFNNHTPPSWRLSSSEGNSCPIFFSKLVKHLFPSDEVQKFVLNWLRNMLVSRNDTALLLVSLMGTGKGIFCEVAEKLVGRANAQRLGEGFFKTQFNAELVNKRLIVFDEVSVTHKNKEQFKLMLNNVIPIEKKGVDVKPAVDNFASFIITNNLISENKLEYKDRRFSVPEMTDTPLNEVFSDDEIGEFIDSLNSDKVLADLGWWILDNCDYGYKVNQPWKDTRFYNLMINGLAEWKKFIVETIQSKKANEYTIKDLKYDYEETTGIRTFAGRVTIENFLAQFRDREGDLIATMKRVGTERVIIPNTKYLSDEITDEFDIVDEFDI